LKVGETVDLNDRELLDDLIIESQEHLATLEPDLLALEKQPPAAEAAELVNRIFRGIHSIKGGCSFLGIKTVQNLTHVMESVLMKVRSGGLKVTPAMVDVLLEGTDRVREMLDDLANSEQVDTADVFRRLEPFLAAEVTAADPEPEAPEEVAQPEPPAEPAGEKKLAGFIPLGKGMRKPVSEEPEVLNEVEVAPASEPAEVEVSRNEPAQAAKSGAATARSASQDVLRVKVDLLNQLMNLAGELVLARNQIVQSLDNKLNETAAGEAIATAASGAIEECRRRLVGTLQDSVHNGMIGSEAAQTLADLLQREFSEMADRVLQGLPNRLSELPGMNATMVNLDAVTTNLQENIMRTRMQSVDALFGKLPRQVRQLAKQVGKEVELTVTGNNVELDKSIIESLSDPLNHLIRNSLDHGFESNKDRVALGKPQECRLAISAFHEGGQVHIEIADDGRGINPEIIKSKAVEKGVITGEEAAAMEDREAIQLIFAPGFSTAAQVSDISGRGVGMDVVRTNIADLGGSIDLDSRLGKGTTVRLKLPLTLAIIPSLLVRVAGRRFAVPQISLDELVRIRRDDRENRIETVQGAEVIRLRGKLLPLVRLSKLLGMAVAEEAEAQRRATHILVLKMGANRYGLVVDEVLDSEEIVVKPLPASLKDARCYAGATIMGDGAVAMILDVLGIAEHAGLHFNGAEALEKVEEHSEGYIDRTESQTLLLFKNASGGENYALNLALISRIEKIPVRDIEKVGGKEYLKIEDSSLRLLRMQDFMPVAGPLEDEEEVYVIIPKLVKHPMGIIAYECEDVITTRAVIDRENVKGPGMLGSAVIEGEMTVFLDIFGLFELAEPEIYQRGQQTRHAVAGARVLLAEDTSFFRAVEKKYLESLGAQVTAVKDGREAWRALSDAEAQFDLVVTDIEMPLMDGLELTRTIRASERWTGIPVVALTSLDSDRNRGAGLDAGVTAYETKLDKDRLAVTLEKVMEEVAVHA
jgi:two-component system chemotaxis sensor kinase CheA